MVIKGLKEVIEKSAEAAELASQSQIRYLYLGDGDTATIRFIDDEEMVQAKIHEYEDITPQGKKYKKAYCANSLTGAPCKWDAAGNVPKNVYVFLVYVYHIIHKSQNPRLNTEDNAAKWEAVKIGAQTLYKEKVDEIRILRIKYGKNGYLKNAVLGFAEEYGTLCDRDYKFVRTGGGKETAYSFVPKDPTEMSEKIIEARKEMPSLEEILIHKKVEAKEAVEDTEVAQEATEENEDKKVVAKSKVGRPRKENSKEDKATEEIEDMF